MTIFCVWGHIMNEAVPVANYLACSDTSYNSYSIVFGCLTKYSTQQLQSYTSARGGGGIQHLISYGDNHSKLFANIVWPHVKCFGVWGAGFGVLAVI